MMTRIFYRKDAENFYRKGAKDFYRKEAKTQRNFGNNLAPLRLCGE